MFVLDEKLKADCFLVCELELSSLLLMNDANYLWLILVPRKANLVELIDLNFAEQSTLLREINAVSKILKNHFAAEKLNIANLGNVVSQLHFHVIARKKNDIAFPKPVWNFAKSKPYQSQETEELIAKIKSLISKMNGLLEETGSKPELNFESNLCNQKIRPSFEQENSSHVANQSFQKTEISNDKDLLDVKVVKSGDLQQTDSDLGIIRKKILYRANYRGCKETDFLLGKFFTAKIDELDLNLCAKFIDEDDLLIYDWILGKKTAPTLYTELVLAIRNFHDC